MTGSTTWGRRAKLSAFIVMCAAAVIIGRTTLAQSDLARRAEEVRRTEQAFARTMADRDFAAFQTFLADEAVFWAGEKGAPVRGRAQVAAVWKRFYDAPAAPFSWRPEQVEVLESGTLGFSLGPVFAPDGRRTGTFNSVWRRQADGTWKIVFDKGCPPCECK
jgi:ketosteroid isomerase-like protein